MTRTEAGLARVDAEAAQAFKDYQRRRKIVNSAFAVLYVLAMFGCAWGIGACCRMQRETEEQMRLNEARRQIREANEQAWRMMRDGGDGELTRVVWGLSKVMMENS